MQGVMNWSGPRGTLAEDWRLWMDGCVSSMPEVTLLASTTPSRACATSFTAVRRSSWREEQMKELMLSEQFSFKVYSHRPGVVLYCLEHVPLCLAVLTCFWELL